MLSGLVAGVLAMVFLRSRRRKLAGISDSETYEARIVRETLGTAGDDFVRDLSRQQRQQLAVALVGLNRRQSRIAAAGLAFLLTVIGGLCGVGVNRFLAPSTAKPIYVFTLGNETPPVAVAAHNRTLLRVLLVAKLTVPSASDQAGPWLVRVRREHASTTHDYYFPLTLVMQGVAGQASLRSGDIVQLVELDATSLGVLQTTNVGTPFTVTGLVERTGAFRSMENSITLMDLNTDEYARQISAQEPPNAIVVTRAVAQNHQEQFYVPLAEPFYSDLLHDSRVRPNDHIEFVRLNASLLLPRID